MRKKKDLCVCGERKGTCMRGEGTQHKGCVLTSQEFKINFLYTHAHTFRVF